MLNKYIKIFLNFNESIDLKLFVIRAGKLLQYLGNVVVNGPTTPLVTDIPCAKITITPPQTPITRPPFGLKDVLKAEGPEGFAKAVRKESTFHFFFCI